MLCFTSCLLLCSAQPKLPTKLILPSYDKLFHIALISLSLTHMSACKQTGTQELANFGYTPTHTQTDTMYLEMSKLWSKLSQFLVPLLSHAWPHKHTDVHAHVCAHRQRHTHTLPALSPGPYCSNDAQLQPMNIPVAVSFLPSLSVL